MNRQQRREAARQAAKGAVTDHYAETIPIRLNAPGGGVVVSWLSPGQLSADFTDSLWDLLEHDRENAHRIAGKISLRSGPRVAEARSQIVDEFLSNPVIGDAEWLLMLDSDMTFDGDLLDRLMEVADPKERPIVGGLCFAGGYGRVFPTLYRLLDEGGDIEPFTEYPRDAVCKVDATGAACMLVHRKVFTVMHKKFEHLPNGAENPYPWFAEGVTNKRGAPYGEDIVFCLKARGLGIPVHVHTGVRLGHMKLIEINEHTFDMVRESLPAEDPAA